MRTRLSLTLARAFLARTGARVGVCDSREGMIEARWLLLFEVVARLFPLVEAKGYANLFLWTGVLRAGCAAEAERNETRAKVSLYLPNGYMLIICALDGAEVVWRRALDSSSSSGSR